ncbi:ribonuclease P/MRP protein subunit POP5 isoform X2 [Canis lupus dingo]|uniref:ribonuclease P/MRP protein subunit POP5 isoform X2 n=1 Tax=Canis lupus dingo TaxID=286419 RepID=UPI0020C3B110|nr:ribonuclease P/MRP protein subunit POP5 isoform X2 [Canis lupus dingo]
MSGRFDRPPLEAWKSWETGLRGHLGGQGAPGMYLAEPGGRGSQPPSHEDFQAALWRGLDGEELRVSANSQHQRASHGSEPAGSFIPSPAFRWLANSLTATSGGTMSQNHPAELLLILDPQQLCEKDIEIQRGPRRSLRNTWKSNRGHPEAMGAKTRCQQLNYFSQTTDTQLPSPAQSWLQEVLRWKD